MYQTENESKEVIMVVPLQLHIIYDSHNYITQKLRKVSGPGIEVGLYIIYKYAF